MDSLLAAQLRPVYAGGLEALVQDLGRLVRAYDARAREPADPRAVRQVRPGLGHTSARSQIRSDWATSLPRVKCGKALAGFILVGASLDLSHQHWHNSRERDAFLWW